MMLYDALLASNRLTPEESISLTPFLGKNANAKKPLAIHFLKEIADTPLINQKEIKRFFVSKKTVIRYGLRVSADN